MHEPDVPYGEDWHSTAEVAAWTEAADQKRPWRSRFRDRIAERIGSIASKARVLELGSGPGFLAEHVLSRCPLVESYTLLDFSEPMLELSRARLARFGVTSFVLASFKSPEWIESVQGPFDCVLSMQAVHELRHKRHASALYRQIHDLVGASGQALICDHTPFDASPKSAALYMTEEEQIRALSDAGFADVRVDLSINGLVLYACRRTSAR